MRVNCFQSIEFWHFYNNGFQNIIQPPTIAWLNKRISNFFECHSYLSLKTSRTKPQKTYEKITTVWMIFRNKLLSSFLMLAIYSFLKCPCYRQTQRSRNNVENTQLKFGSPLRDPFLTLLHLCLGFDRYCTFVTTGLDQLTNRCVRLRWQLFLHCIAEPWW